MVMTWQADPQVIGDVKDPDDEGACPGTDGGEVDEEEYNRYVHLTAGPLPSAENAPSQPHGQVSSIPFPPGCQPTLEEFEGSGNAP